MGRYIYTYANKTGSFSLCNLDELYIYFFLFGGDALYELRER